MKLKNILVVLGAALVLLVAVLWLAGGGGESAAEEPPSREKASRRIGEAKKRVKDKRERNNKASRTDRKSRQKGVATAKRKGARPVTDDYSPEDRKLADAVQDALDDDDFKATRKAALAAMKSENPSVREEAVDALGWFGEKALVDLTKAMADKDSDVADSARSHVEDTLMGMGDDDRAFVLASEYLKLFAEDDEAVTMFAGVLSSTSAQLIDPDNADSAADVAKAKGNRAGIVDIVDELVSKGGKLAERGRELYEDVTGEEWVDRATADAWAEDIEEPDAEDDDD